MTAEAGAFRVLHARARRRRHPLVRWYRRNERVVLSILGTVLFFVLWQAGADVGAIDKLHKKLGWGPDNVDLYEINEAFAVVTMAEMHDLKLPHAKVNVNGGACALGHPIGASGARLIVTLLHALKARGGKRGIHTEHLGYLLAEMQFLQRAYPGATW